MKPPRKGKPLKWHISYGPRTPRINLNKLVVVNHELASNKEYNDRVEKCVQNAEARKIPIVIDQKDFDMMRKDVKSTVKVPDLKFAGIFLYAGGIIVSEFITPEIQKFRDSMLKHIPDKVEELTGEEVERSKREVEEKFNKKE